MSVVTVVVGGYALIGDHVFREFDRHVGVVGRVACGGVKSVVEGFVVVGDNVFGIGFYVF